MTEESTMVDYEQLKALAIECGFDHVGDLDADTIQVRPEVREACAEDKCQSYGKNWICPPACGTLEQCSERIHSSPVHRRTGRQL